jgi:hypothetical protein
VILPPVAGGLSGSVVLPAASIGATVTLTLSASPPSGVPALQSDRRLVRTLGSTPTGIAYFTAQSSPTVSFGTSLGAMIATTTQVGGSEYLVLFDPSNATAGWNAIAGPGSPSSGIPAGGNVAAVTFQQGVTYDLALVSTQSALTVPTPTPSPSPTPAPVAVNVSALQLQGVGAAYAQTVTVTQSGYNGLFTLGGTSCNGIAAADTSTSLKDFTITPVAVGMCSYTFTGGGGVQTTLPVSVTSLTIGGQ